MSSIKKYWHLFWHFRRLAVMLMMEYRTDFFFWSAVTIMWTIFNLFFFSLLIQVNNGLAGWSAWELYTLMSFFAIIDAFTWSLFANNMWHFTNNIFTGELSTFLLKPVDTQFMVMLQHNSYNNLFRIAISLGVILFSVNKLGIQPSWWQYLLSLSLLVCSLVLLYSLWLMVACGAFWVERLNNINEIIPGLRRLWQVPRQVYEGFGSTLTTVLVPLTLLSSLPSEVLLLRTVSPLLLGYFVVLSFFMLWLSRQVLYFSLRNYQSVGG